MHRTMIALATSALLACAHGNGKPVYTFQGTAPRQPPKAANCDFDVAAQIPEGSEYEELGVLDAARIPSRNLGTFKMHAAPTVCQAGGDLVVGQINGQGYYMRGIVFHRRLRATPPAAPSPAAAGGTKL